MNVKEISKYSVREFKRVVGVDWKTFSLMKDILDKEYRKKHSWERSPKLSVEDMLLLEMGYWRGKRTYGQIAASYGLSVIRSG